MKLMNRVFGMSYFPIIFNDLMRVTGGPFIPYATISLRIDH